MAKLVLIEETHADLIDRDTCKIYQDHRDSGDLSSAWLDMRIEHMRQVITEFRQAAVLIYGKDWGEWVDTALLPPRIEVLKASISDDYKHRFISPSSNLLAYFYKTTLERAAEQIIKDLERNRQVEAKEIEFEAAKGNRPTLKSTRGRKKGAVRSEVRHRRIAIREAKREGHRPTAEILDYLVRRQSLQPTTTPIISEWRTEYGVKTWEEVRSKCKSNAGLLAKVTKDFAKVKA